MGKLMKEKMCTSKFIFYFKTENNTSKKYVTVNTGDRYHFIHGIINGKLFRA